MKIITQFIVPAILLILGHSTASATTVYMGNWQNNTFGSTGSAVFSVDIDIPGDNFSIMMDLGGNVFGGSDPTPVILSGTISSGIVAPVNHPVYGDIGGTFNTTTGEFNGSATNIPGLDHALISGLLTPSTIQLNYQIFLGPRDPDDFLADGVINANASVVPVPAAIWLFISACLGITGFAHRKSK